MTMNNCFLFLLLFLTITYAGRNKLNVNQMSLIIVSSCILFLLYQGRKKEKFSWSDLNPIKYITNYGGDAMIWFTSDVLKIDRPCEKRAKSKFEYITKGKTDHRIVHKMAEKLTKHVKDDGIDLSNEATQEAMKSVIAAQSFIIVDWTTEYKNAGLNHFTFVTMEELVSILVNPATPNAIRKTMLKAYSTGYETIRQLCYYDECGSQISQDDRISAGGLFDPYNPNLKDPSRLAMVFVETASLAIALYPGGSGAKAFIAAQEAATVAGKTGVAVTMAAVKAGFSASFKYMVASEAAMKTILKVSPLVVGKVRELLKKPSSKRTSSEIDETASAYNEVGKKLQKYADDNNMTTTEAWDEITTPPPQNYICDTEKKCATTIMPQPNGEIWYMAQTCKINNDPLQPELFNSCKVTENVTQEEAVNPPGQYCCHTCQSYPYCTEKWNEEGESDNPQKLGPTCKDNKYTYCAADTNIGSNWGTMTAKGRHICGENMSCDTGLKM